ncbi:hypothetical protein BC628DRAFT_856160 [Trametes gibbosa]|nr:hypothetical protein BC628DRAFT_856160 [Trametes gibbosa]
MLIRPPSLAAMNTHVMRSPVTSREESSQDELDCISAPEDPGKGEGGDESISAAAASHTSNLQEQTLSDLGTRIPDGVLVCVLETTRAPHGTTRIPSILYEQKRTPANFDKIPKKALQSALMDIFKDVLLLQMSKQACHAINRQRQSDPTSQSIAALVMLGPAMCSEDDHFKDPTWTPSNGHKKRTIQGSRRAKPSTSEQASKLGHQEKAPPPGSAVLVKPGDDTSDLFKRLFDIFGEFNHVRYSHAAEDKKMVREVLALIRSRTLERHAPTLFPNLTPQNYPMDISQMYTALWEHKLQAAERGRTPHSDGDVLEGTSMAGASVETEVRAGAKGKGKEKEMGKSKGKSKSKSKGKGKGKDSESERELEDW